VNNKMRGITSFIYIPLLAMGGLLREKGHGTSLLSLSLPVGRLQHLGIRATVGLLEVAVIAMAPAVIVPVLSPAVGESYPVSAAAHYTLLWVVYGTAAFAIAFLVSTILTNEYAALIGSFIVLVVVNLLTPVAASGITTGMPTMTAAQMRGFSGFPGPIPWL